MSLRIQLSDALVERDPVTLLALATDLHPQRVVVELQDVLSAHDQLAPPGRGQGKASFASPHSGNNSASTGCPSVSQKGSGYRQMKSSSDNGLDETRTSGTCPPYLVSPFVRSGALAASPSALVFRHILQHPTHDCRVGDDDLALGHHRGQIPVAQPISGVTANAEFDGFS
jgi:hypothetical protein